MKIVLPVLLVMGCVSASVSVSVGMEAMSSVKVEKLVLATGVEAREPVGEAAEFDTSIKRIYCWTKVVPQTTPTTLKHVWSADGKVINAVSLTLSTSPSRTWSYKTVWPAQWKVEVVDESGTVIASREFSVVQAVTPPQP